MKNIILLITACLFVVSSEAQTPDEKSINAKVEELRIAMVDGNRESLKAIAAEELSYGHSSGLIEDKAAFVENIASGNSDFVNIALSDQTVRIVGNTAIVRHRLVGDTKNAGTPGKANISVLLIWQKQNNQWKLLARQATKLQ